MKKKNLSVATALLAMAMSGVDMESTSTKKRRTTGVEPPNDSDEAALVRLRKSYPQMFKR